MQKALGIPGGPLGNDFSVTIVVCNSDSVDRQLLAGGGIVLGVTRVIRHPGNPAVTRPLMLMVRRLRLGAPAERIVIPSMAGQVGAVCEEALRIETER